MAIEFKPHLWTYGIWLSPLPEAADGPGNWMCAAQRDLEQNRTIIKWRFRYYHDEKAHFSRDTRSWYVMELEGISDEVMDRAVRAVQSAIAEMLVGLGVGEEKVEFLSFKCTSEGPEFVQAIKRMQASPNFSMATPEQMQQYKAPEN